MTIKKAEEKPGFLDDTEHFVGWGEFCEPQQHPFEFVGVRSSPATYRTGFLKKKVNPRHQAF
jgi:hypothetical protein